MRALVGALVTLLCSACIYNADRNLADGAPDRPFDGWVPELPVADVVRIDVPPDAHLPDGSHRDDTITCDGKYDRPPLMPDKCVPNCSAVCGANDGCGGKCYSDNDVEPCTAAEYVLWRCVLSSGAQGYGTPISQVCQESPNRNNKLYWRTFYPNPIGCNACCGKLGTAPTPCKP
jgi:hypothetical protein